MLDTTLRTDTRSHMEAVLGRITMPFGWSLLLETKHGAPALRVADLQGSDNVTGASMPWKGRPWMLSQHMTDGEIANTAFLATLTALEHEVREMFLYRGQAIYDPHYDIEKLVELRRQPDALKERDPT